MINRDFHKHLKLRSFLIACGFCTFGMNAANADITLTFNNTVTPDTGTQYTLPSGVYVSGSFIQTAPALDAAFGLNAVGSAAEFRMVGSDGAVGGGGEKSLVGRRDDGSGTDADTFDHGFDATNTLTSLVGTDTTPGAANDPDAPTGTAGLYTNAIFFSQNFGFHQAAAPASISLNTSTNTISVQMDLITAQWGGQYFPMGDAAGGANQCNTDGQGCGITFSGTISNVGTDGSGNTTFDFVLFGEHRVTPYEDTEGGTANPAGFAGWVAQWEVHGSGVDVPVIGNIPPTADAGPAQTVIEGDTVTLDGSQSTDTDGTITDYLWTQIGGTTTVTLSDATVAMPDFTAPAAPDTLTFQLEVTDDGNDTDTDTVIITVNANQPPVADAGTDQNVIEGTQVTLDGTSSTDPDGGALTYNWTQTGGTATVSLSDPTIANPTFTAPAAPDSLSFSLTVTDDRNAMDTASVNITVSTAPSPDALNAVNDALIMAVGATNGIVNVLSNDSGDQTLRVSASDGASMEGGTVNCSATGACTYDPPSPTFTGADKFTYTASDNTGSDTATVFITVASIPTDGSVLTFHNRGAADQEIRYSLQGGVYIGSSFTPTGAAFDAVFTTNTAGSNSEYRMIDPSSGIGGGGEKSVAGKRDDGTGTDEDIYQWVFDGNNTLLNGSGFIDTDATPVTPQDTPSSDAGAHTNAVFFGGDFGFQLTPGATGQMNLDLANDTLTITWPQGLNAHWGGRFFPLGEPNPANQCNTDGQGCGITMSGPATNVVTAGGMTTFDFKLFGEYRITPFEDTERNTNTGAGFAGWRPQWEMNGSGVITAEIAALESPSADNGDIGPTPGSAADGNSFNDGRVSLAELTADGVPADTGVERSCVGSCFAVTVTGMTLPAVKIMLPLSSPIPNNPGYRKYLNAAWKDFDESTGDTIESAASGGALCSSLPDAAFSSGLTSGHNCIRLTITDGGPNDADGAQNGEVTDPGGTGILLAGSAVSERPGDNVGGGCIVVTTANSASQRADWWILTAFIILLARKRYRRMQSLN